MFGVAFATAVAGHLDIVFFWMQLVASFKTFVGSCVYVRDTYTHYCVQYTRNHMVTKKKGGKQKMAFHQLFFAAAHFLQFTIMVGTWYTIWYGTITLVSSVG